MKAFFARTSRSGSMFFTPRSTASKSRNDQAALEEEEFLAQPVASNAVHNADNNSSKRESQRHSNREWLASKRHELDEMLGAFQAANTNKANDNGQEERSNAEGAGARARVASVKEEEEGEGEIEDEEEGEGEGREEGEEEGEEDDEDDEDDELRLSSPEDDGGEQDRADFDQQQQGDGIEGEGEGWEEQRMARADSRALAELPVVLAENARLREKLVVASATIEGLKAKGQAQHRQLRAREDEHNKDKKELNKLRVRLAFLEWRLDSAPAFRPPSARARTHVVPGRGSSGRLSRRFSLSKAVNSISRRLSGEVTPRKAQGKSANPRAKFADRAGVGGMASEIAKKQRPQSMRADQQADGDARPQYGRARTTRRSLGAKRKKTEPDEEPQDEQEPASYAEYVVALSAPPPDLPPVETNIVVAVRCRPLSKGEFELKHKDVVRIVDGQSVMVDVRRATGAELDYLASKRVGNKSFVFDRAYGGLGCSQKDVFDGVVSNLLDGLVNNQQNATVFAYGATGAGKTHTMLGNPNDPGITVLAMQRLFQLLQGDANAHVTVSFLEVYCERIKDLLNTQPLAPGEEPRYLEVKETKEGDVVPGLTFLEVSSAEDTMHRLHEGNTRRTVRATSANEESSRSHAVFQVRLKRMFSNGARTSVLSMIDLAGSERIKKSEVEGLGATEAKRINHSLLSLGNCITKLASGKGHVPYRDSKLTRLLHESLQGNCRTVMITAVSPSHAQVEETLNTLKYADRAKQIRTVVKGTASG